MKFIIADFYGPEGEISRWVELQHVDEYFDGKLGRQHLMSRIQLSNDFIKKNSLNVGSPLTLNFG